MLQALPNGPFAIAEPGSRNEAFIVNPGPAIHIDIPIDPLSSRLYPDQGYVEKDTAAVGDFVPYKLTVENLDRTAPVPGVTITDRLPAGFRYRKGSARRTTALLSSLSFPKMAGVSPLPWAISVRQQLPTLDMLWKSVLARVLRRP